MNTQPSVPAFITHANLKCKKYIHLCDEICVWFHLKVGNQFCSLYQVDWRNLMKQSVTVGAQLLWGGRYGCNNGRYGCTIVMSYIEINKAVSQWLLTFNLCVSVTWPLTCAFHIPCTHTPEIIDMHRGMCDKRLSCIDPSSRCPKCTLLITQNIFELVIKMSNADQRWIHIWKIERNSKLWRVILFKSNLTMN